ncbi:MAG: MBL fold metallo-hydrolase [Thermodesulfobacteriota bacterium]
MRPDDSPLEVRQIRLSRMALFCYLVADPASAECLLIDPAFDADRLLSMTREAGYAVRFVVNTHGHADHCCGNAAVVAATGAGLRIHEKDAGRLTGFLSGFFCRVLGGRPSPRPDGLLKHGDVLPVGKEGLTVLHTPGHTPGSICLYTPGHLFTGDTLFVGSAGRTDLSGGSTRDLLSSIRHHLFSLSDNTRVWPGHDYGDRSFSTIGHEKQTNPFMQAGFEGSRGSRSQGVK